MKNNFEIIFIVTLCYLLLLYIIGYISEKLYKKDSRLICNPYVYTLTLAVYCTTWTYYGSVGRAVSNGIEFLAIYIGPTLIIFTWWFFLRKLVRIAENHSVTSIADFISFRYGKSKKLGILVTILCLVGVIPYISLQLKAINETILLLSYNTPTLGTKELLVKDTAFYVSIIIGLFGALFGTRHFGDHRKHPPLVGVVAFESLVKLVIFLIAGVFITFFMFDGFKDILNQLLSSDNSLIMGKLDSILTINTSRVASTEWMALIVMSMFAVMFLPRQFHMAVIENTDEKHIIKAMFLFPLYLFLINIFVIPIAFAGMIKFNGGGNPDYYSIGLLIQNGNYWLASLVYLGGLSAATGMIIVTSVSLANMFINNFVLPFIVKFVIKINLGMIIPHLKRAATLFVVMAGYYYFIKVGSSFSLVNIGLTSFAAVSQFAPAIILGLFWRDANEKGAITGISLGFFIWFYTLIIPYLAKSGVIGYDINIYGPFGIKFLKPTGLFGLDTLDIWSHTLFWSLLFNISGLVLVSVLTKKNSLEDETASLCVDSFSLGYIARKRSVIEGLSVDDIENILNNFFGKKVSQEKIDNFLKMINKGKDNLNMTEITTLRDSAEEMLSSAVGPGAAKLIFESYSQIKGKGETKVIDVFKDLLSYGVGESKDTLIKRISELNVLLDISRIFSSVNTLETKVYKALELIKNTFHFDLVILRRRNENVLSAYSYVGEIHSSLVTSYRAIDPEKSFIGKSVVQKMPFAVNDINQIELNEFSIDLKKNNVISFAHIPLIIDNEVKGIISCYSKVYKNLFSKEIMNLLQSIANQMGYMINNHYQTEELIKMREVSKELEIAKGIQKSLLPEVYPEIDGVKMLGACYPSEFVGGDYYDFYKIRDGVFDVIIADVSGHNVASALIMSELRSIIKSIISFQSNITPAKIMTLLNREIYQDLTKLEFIITMIYMRVNLNNGMLTFANAGHHPPIVFQPGKEITEISFGDPLLGVMEDINYRETTYNLKNNDMVFMYTDGIIETENEKGEFYGVERLKNLLFKSEQSELSALFKVIVDDTLTFRGSFQQADDITMAAFTVNFK
ncbi:SpoIIE family protein phosphatase [Deferribacteraceae bacterium V6Fe1]|nr:SpoIIE family protein phosphatase [Deferribacteraceae bacterium V6Fe1]